MRGGRARLAAAVVLLLVAGAGAGCGRLPSSGPVVSGPRLADDPSFGLIQFVPEGPVAGASPTDVVAGFLRASSSSRDDHAVARSFLTAQAAARWRPETSTTICQRMPSIVLPADPDPAHAGAVPSPPGVAVPEPGAPEAVVPGPAVGGALSVTLQGPVVATIDAQGRRAEQPPGARLSQRLLLLRERGEWRIDWLPDGVVISAADASRTLRPFTLAFATPDGSRLVPEVRWFAYGPNTATRIVRELLHGPSPWLAPAVTSGAPPGTQLRLRSVPVADGVASVDLSDAALVTTPQERRLLLSQLHTSLTGVRGIGSVRVTVNGVELTGPQGRLRAEPRAPGSDGRLLVLGPEGLARYDGARLDTVQGPDGAALEARGVTHPAVSPAGGPYAMLAGGRRLLVQRPGNAPIVAVDGEDDLAPPSADRHGWVWTASGSTVLAVPTAAPAGGPVEVQGPPGGETGRVLQLRVSRDGSRVLLVTEQAEGAPVAAVHGVDRDVSGRPVRLTARGPVLAPGAAEVLDLSWLGEEHAVLLVRRPGEASPRPVIAQIGGPVRLLPQVPGGVSVAAGDTEREVVVGTANGRLLVRSGADWMVVAAGRHPAYPG
ncbi:sporulation and spore germination protein [Kineococcus xinjiangensis]|uniref:Sporulation and spore germination protein n=1 Tax=Kineococcus xinjiangensis TaxID=512762 RepID=A0A2S6IUG2_9ACTN|nr:LpqB family beta-propeller domain-containing protein [Kineococcus xinjiangensis]PPK97820.1 sporulation and spore germination protein [Kineococcus xinjiangensis]